MKFIISLCVAVSLFVGAQPALAADETSDAVNFKASHDTWDKLKEQCGGSYRYFVRTSSFSGARTETEVVVFGNRVTGRRYKVTGGFHPGLEVAPALPGKQPAKPAEPEYKWTERGDEVGSHREGAPAKTLDELYAEAATVLAHALRPSEKRYVRFDDQGLLKCCFYVDTRIADDAPTTGVNISEIRLDGVGAGAGGKAANALSEAPATITVDGKVVALRVEAINNRMPTIGPRQGTGIYFIVRLTTNDGSPLPEGLVFDTVYGIQGERKWETQTFDEPRRGAPATVEIVARNAPTWAASAKLDVVLKIRDAANNEHLIRAAGVSAMEVH